ncbi:hypothetical protein N9X53_07695 [Mariniblastus sp.]|nr:hypothetical protein [Mariniblastus sp.]
MKPSIKVFSDLLELWRKQSDTPTNPPIAPSELLVIFSNLEIALTRDVVALYSITGGMPDGYPDDRMFELWGRDRLKRENAKSTWDYCWIGDWLISSHLYAIKPVDLETSAVYIDHICDRKTTPEFVAESVYEFAEMLLTDPPSVGVVL